MPGIIATIWPSINTPEILQQLYQNGACILRFNFTHETNISAVERLAIIKQVEQKTASKFQLMMDLEWPSIRTWVIGAPRHYKKWELCKLIVGKQQPKNNDIRCDYPGIIHNVEVWSLIKIESWLFDTIVREKWSDYIIIEAMNDFTMTSKRHINLPGIHIDLPTITTKDQENILFAIKNTFDYIAISFCRSAGDIQYVKSLLPKKSQIKIVSKIENQEGIDNIDEIIDASDMVMVARGDLGTELPIEKIPEIQMEIIKKCKFKHTPVIVATQMLSSMVTNPAPTRAEISDIFLAIIEGADYLMLSEETTIGLHPIESVQMINKVISEVQNGR